MTAKRTRMIWVAMLVLVVPALAGCSEVTINVNVRPTQEAEVTEAVDPAVVLEPASPTSVHEDVVVSAGEVALAASTATPLPTSTPVVAAPTATDESAPADAPATGEPAAEAGDEAPTEQADDGTAPTSPPPTNPPPSATATPVPTRVPLRPTAESCATYQGQTYTLVLNEAQVNALLDAALVVTERAYVGTRGVGLQNGQITAYTQYAAAGQTVDGTLVLAVSVRNYDVHVAVVQAKVGQVGLTDARMAAINSAMERALETEMAQAHDYTCVDAITIAGGTMTIIYH